MSKQSRVTAAITAFFTGILVASAATNSSWSAPLGVAITNKVERTVVETNTVVHTSAAIRINLISIRVHPVTDEVSVSVGWAWVDEDGKTIPGKSGINRFNQSQISEKLESKGSSLDAMRQLFMALAAEDAVTPDQ